MNYRTQAPPHPPTLNELHGAWVRSPAFRIVEIGLLLLAAVISVFFVSGCASQQVNPLNVAILANRASVILVDAETATINAQVEADYEPRARACKESPSCLAEAKLATHDKLGLRIALGRAAIEAQHRAADALEAAKKCKPEDESCRMFFALAASAAEAEVALVLARLRRTPPLPAPVQTASAP